MLLKLDFSNDVPIYQQIRDQIVVAIASGQLVPGDKLPTIRTLAEEAGINMMTASKAYQLLKTEGYITTGRRDGATVRLPAAGASPKTVEDLRLKLCELRLAGMERTDILELCGKLIDEEASEK
ncbi:MAG: GntR family transcriptional regulator [Acetatifactor sp.]|nr:GntR family transcriptional regulator [Acetatifactor sp.]